MEKNKKIALLFLLGGIIMISAAVFFMKTIYNSDKNSERELRIKDSLEQVDSHNHNGH
jgi:hypothetical protein